MDGCILLDWAYEIAYVLGMKVITATRARSQLYSLIDEAVESREPVQILGKRGSAVLLSAEDWSALQETLYLVSIPGMRQSIREGMATPVDKCAKELKW